MNLKLSRGMLGLAALAVAAQAYSASHNDAPLIHADPAANITDVYAFVGRNASNQKVLNVVMTVNPLEDPGDGVNYYRFGTDIRYSIHIEKPRLQGGSPNFKGDTSIRYDFYFENDLKNGNTILSYGLGTEAGAINTTGDARQNLTQSYRVVKGSGFFPPGGVGFPGNGPSYLVPPVNVGPRTTPNYYSNGVEIQGATTEAELDSYTRNAIYTMPGGTRVFAGQREDGFYADVAGIFDLLGVRNPGVDLFGGYNLHTIALQIPVSELVSGNDVPILGVFATTSRRKVSVMNGWPQGTNQNGPWTQVGRMGNPLFNEALVALKDKDRYNMVAPTGDKANFSRYAREPELAVLLNLVFSANFETTNREDLVGIFIPDVIKVDTSTDPVRLAGQKGFNRLSVFGGETIFSPYQNADIAAGWPNGRRFGDDVIDIALTAIASGPTYNTITALGDNVNSNDAIYNLVFPYAATPWGGPTTPLH